MFPFILRSIALIGIDSVQMPLKNAAKCGSGSPPTYARADSTASAPAKSPLPSFPMRWTPYSPERTLVAPSSASERCFRRREPMR